MFFGENFYATVISETSRLADWETAHYGDSSHLMSAIDGLKDISIVVPIIDQSAILQTLVKMLDKRDAYTAFHSERVSLMALRLCFAHCFPLT